MANLFSIDFLLTAFLIMVRVTSIMMTAPFFGSLTIPTRVKLFFALSITIVLYPVVPLQGAVIALDATNLEVVVAIILEVLVGVSMGLVGQIIFGGLQFGGQFISIQTALGFANIVDPQNQQQSAIFSQIFALLGVVLFLAIGGDHIYLRAMAKSFEIVPIGNMNIAAAAPVFVEMASDLFVIGVQLASPFIIVLFLLDLSFAIFARIMPQANIFFIALPLKVFGGILMMALISDGLGIAFNQFFQMLFDYLEEILFTISGR